MCKTITGILFIILVLGCDFQKEDSPDFIDTRGHFSVALENIDDADFEKFRKELAADVFNDANKKYDKYASLWIRNDSSHSFFINVYNSILTYHKFLLHPADTTKGIIEYMDSFFIPSKQPTTYEIKPGMMKQFYLPYTYLFNKRGKIPLRIDNGNIYVGYSFKERNTINPIESSLQLILNIDSVGNVRLKKCKAIDRRD
ncbi:hypothetical protein QNI16_09110 [Cytophagaceae bacterium YF14B1]|uniref:Lipoprotein n=1 Tax=Xanthocytophaga flava TaxID=3048013 RepID=A0AAE3QJR3_9BACT|nr:hypothetical protein [Xanthocytophaga flavus]MDJ1480642.1 hypothetical protein [Xanthocytophaga flavus]